MYDLVIPDSLQKDIRRLDKPVQRELRDKHFLRIKDDPYRAEPLRGSLKGVWSYHFTSGSTQYRIAYEILPKERIILLIMVGKRGDFYEALMRRLGLW